MATMVLLWALLVFLPQTNCSLSTEGLLLNMSTILRQPFLYDIVDLDNKTKRVGYIQDLINELQLRMGFEYNYLIVPDGNYGAPIGNDTWNGMIGELYHGRADMIAADLTVNALRSEVVEYTVPFMRIDLGVVYKKPTVKFGVLAYMMPFSNRVWLVILGSLFVTSAALYFFGMFETNKDRFESVVSCLYFGLACLFAQGPEYYPKSISARTTAVAWWFFSLMMLTLYTSSLTAMLTVNRVQLPIETVEDLLDYPDFHYAVEPGQATNLAFKLTSYEPFQKMYQDMISRDTGFFIDYIGMERVRSRNDFAFIRESPYIDYDITFAPCDLEVIYSSASPKTGAGYGFAFSKGSPLADIFSAKILELVEDGTNAKIHKKWFVLRSQCSDKKKLAEEVSTINFKEIQGIFLTFGLGIAISFVLFGIRLARKAVQAKGCPETRFMRKKSR